MVLARVIVLGHVNPHFIIPNFNRIAADVIGPLVKSPATFQIETCVVPMASEYAIFDCASFQGKTHMRAAIIDGKNFIPSGKKCDRMSI
jgi:hypothetical protein